MEYQINFHDGAEIVLDFNEDKHVYKIDGEYVPSVTTILNTISKPALLPWAVKMGADWFSDNCEAFTQATLSVDEVVKGIKGAYKKKSRDAMNVGNIVHQWCEDAIQWKMGVGEIPDMPEDTQAVTAINAFRNWIGTREIKWIAAEQKLYNRKYKYAGTVDAVAEIDGAFCVIDFKTSAAVYDEYYLQCAAYAEAIQDMYGREVDSAWVLRFDKRTGKFEAKDSEEHDENFSGFYGAMLLYSRLTALKNRKKR